jgi:hypothetical protein
VSLDEAEDYIMAGLAQLMRLFEHPVGLADSGGPAEIDFQLPLFRLPYEIEKNFRIFAIVTVHRDRARL